MNNKIIAQNDIYTNTIQQTTEYICFGLDPVYVAYRGKEAKISGWEKSDSILNFNKRVKNGKPFNVGIKGGNGLLILDVDDFDKSGKPTCAQDRIKAAGLIIPTTPTVKSSNGHHYYFKVPIDCTVTNKQDRGIDIKCVGGYCVAPPSEHPLGSFYTWEKGLGLNDVPMADCPQWVFDYFYSKDNLLPGESVKEKEEKVINTTPLNNLAVSNLQETKDQRVNRARNHILYKIPAAIEGSGGSRQTMFASNDLVLGFELDYQDALTLLKVYNERCLPKWTDREIVKFIDSSFTYKEKCIKEENNKIGFFNRTKKEASMITSINKLGLMQYFTMESYGLLEYLIDKRWTNLDNAHPDSNVKLLMDQGFICMVSSQKLIAEDLGVTTKTFRGMIQKLMDKCFIHQEKDSVGTWFNNVYVLGKDGKYFWQYLIDCIYSEYNNDESGKTLKEVAQDVVQSNRWIESLPTPNLAPLNQ